MPSFFINMKNHYLLSCWKSKAGKIEEVWVLKKNYTSESYIYIWPMPQRNTVSTLSCTTELKKAVYWFELSETVWGVSGWGGEGKSREHKWNTLNWLKLPQVFGWPSSPGLLEVPVYPVQGPSEDLRQFVFGRIGQIKATLHSRFRTFPLYFEHSCIMITLSYLLLI